MKIIDNSFGFKEIIVNENCEFEVFYLCAENLARNLNIVYTKQIDDYDSLYWELNFMGSMFILHYNIYLGISIYPEKARNASDADNEILGIIYELIKDTNLCRND